jgi:hypothetical protein
MSPEMAVLLGFTAHLVGDYLLQSDYMAAEKTQHWKPAVQHGLLYAVPFLPILWVSSAPVWALVVAMAAIAGTHIPIDHYRLARYVVWLKNQWAPRSWRHRWDDHVSATGYHGGLDGLWDLDSASTFPGDWKDCERQQKPIWMAVWLMILADNTIHVCLNTAALWWAVTR